MASRLTLFWWCVKNEPICSRWVNELLSSVPPNLFSNTKVNARAEHAAGQTVNKLNIMHRLRKFCNTLLMILRGPKWVIACNVNHVVAEPGWTFASHTSKGLTQEHQG